CMQALEYPNSF
nr:immunoglobulin light chain junction region [Macaca mulatta]MOV35378.1 immunoglobulin light chain junction region [Macaca mulatta]